MDINQFPSIEELKISIFSNHEVINYLESYITSLVEYGDTVVEIKVVNDVDSLKGYSFQYTGNFSGVYTQQLDERYMDIIHNRGLSELVSAKFTLTKKVDNLYYLESAYSGRNLVVDEYNKKVSEYINYFKNALIKGNDKVEVSKSGFKHLTAYLVFIAELKKKYRVINAGRNSYYVMLDWR